MTRTSLLVAPLVVALLGTVYALDYPTHYRERLARFTRQNASLPAGREHVVLLGDSLTEGWEAGGRTARYLPEVAERVLNRGIASDGLGVGSRGIRHRLDASVFACNPSHVVLLAGVNDVGRDGSGVARSARHYRSVAQTIRDRLPDVTLILVTVPSARGGYAALNPHVRTYNQHVRETAAAVDATVLDLHALLLDERGQLRADLTSDGLHWNNRGYAIYGQALQPLLTTASSDLGAAGAAAGAGATAGAGAARGIIDRLRGR